jgi:hypothetical protein
MHDGIHSRQVSLESPRVTDHVGSDDLGGLLFGWQMLIYILKSEVS